MLFKVHSELGFINNALELHYEFRAHASNRSLSKFDRLASSAVSKPTMQNYNSIMEHIISEFS